MNRRSRSEQEVLTLLRSSGVSAPPVPVERLGRELGIQIRYEPFDGNLSGLLYKDAGQVVIGVNTLHSRARQRFTIAHELGHFLLHELDQIHIDRDFRIRHRNEVSSHGTDLDEISANAFAAELLMPRQMLVTDLGEHAIDLEDDERLQALASRYQVSLQALIIRLTNLELLQQPRTDG